MGNYRELYEKQIEELVRACHLMGRKGLTSSVGGNLSMRVSDEHILITPTNMQKELLQPEDICVVDYSGNIVYAKEGIEQTSETPFHTMIMRNREDIISVAHAHCTALSAFAISTSHLLERPYFPESLMEIGPIITVPYTEPSSDKLANMIEKYIFKSNGFLLQNHGALALSPKTPVDVVERLYMMESVAQSIYMAINLGETKSLSREDVMEIEALQTSKGLRTDIEPISTTVLFE